MTKFNYLTFWDVDDDPFIHESSRQGLQRQQALPGAPVAGEDDAGGLLLRHGLVKAGDQVDGLAADQHVRRAEEAPVLCGLEGLDSAQLVDEVRGQPYDPAYGLRVDDVHVVLFRVVVVVAGVQQRQALHLQRVVVAQLDLLPERLALARRHGPLLVPLPVLLPAQHQLLPRSDVSRHARA